MIRLVCAVLFAIGFVLAAVGQAGAIGWTPIQTANGAWGYYYVQTSADPMACIGIGSRGTGASSIPSYAGLSLTQETDHYVDTNTIYDYHADGQNSCTNLVNGTAVVRVEIWSEGTGFLHYEFGYLYVSEHYCCYHVWARQ